MTQALTSTWSLVSRVPTTACWVGQSAASTSSSTASWERTPPSFTRLYHPALTLWVRPPAASLSMPSLASRMCLWGPPIPVLTFSIMLLVWRLRSSLARRHLWGSECRSAGWLSLTRSVSTFVSGTGSLSSLYLVAPPCPLFCCPLICYAPALRS